MATVEGFDNFPLGMAVTPGGDFVYVTNINSGTVSVISTESNTIVATVEGFDVPRYIAITPDGEYAYVANQEAGTVSVISTETNTVIATVDGVDKMWDVAITPDGTSVYVTSIFAGVTVISTETNTVVANVDVGDGPGYVAITPDGAFAYVTSELSCRFSVISTLTNTVVADFFPGTCDPQDVAVMPDGSAFITFLFHPRLQEILTDPYLPGSTFDYDDPGENDPSPTHLALARGPAGFDRASDVVVCHRTQGTNSFNLMLVAASAFNNHVAHGDGRVGDPVPGQPGVVFGADCTLNLPDIVPTVDASIRDGLSAPKDGVPDQILENSIVQAGDVPQFEDRGIIEFEISSLSQPVGLVELNVPVFGSNGPFPFTIDVFAYAGDGAINLSDFSAGSFVTSFAYAGEVHVTIDVTSVINSLITSSEDFAGFNFQFSVPSAIALNGPFIAFNSIEIGPPTFLSFTIP